MPIINLKKIDKKHEFYNRKKRLTIFKMVRRSEKYIVKTSLLLNQFNYSMFAF